MMNFTKYENYKDSSLDEIAEIPTEWNIVSLKKILSSQDGIKIGPFGSALKLSVMKESGYKVYGQENVINNDFSLGNKYIDEEQFKELKNVEIKSGDVVITMMGTTGKCKVVPPQIERGIMDSHLIRVRLERNAVYSELLSLLINDSQYIFNQLKKLSKGSIMEGLNSRIIKSLQIIIPPLKIQTIITKYLNERNAQIDKKIELLQAKKEKYQELRKTIINEALTKGLDKTVELKDSNVEWLGKIPKHWEVKRVKDLFKLITDIAPNDNDYQLLSIYTSIGVKPRAELEQRGNKAITTDGYWIVKKGDFIVNKLLAWMGAIALSDYDGVTSPAYDILRKKVPLIQKYYEYLFRTEAAQAEFKRNSRGIMEVRLRLYFDKFGAISVPVQSLEEQQQIADYLDDKTQKIDAIIAKIDENIVALNEFRKTLINDAVTGKIKVF